MRELKPCPFCGIDVTIYYSAETRRYYFMHTYKKGNVKDCILLTPAMILGEHKSLKDAYNAWNRRTGENG